MKRKTIIELLTIEDPTAALNRLLPPDATADTDAARKILASAITASRKQNTTDPAVFHALVCTSPIEQLVQLLAKTPAAKFPIDQIARSQAILRPLFASKAGRPPSSELSRREQLAAAQARRREKLGLDEGRKQLNDWISTEAAAYLMEIKEQHGCASRAEALEMVLQAAIRGEVLKAPKK